MLRLLLLFGLNQNHNGICFGGSVLGSFLLLTIHEKGGVLGEKNRMRYRVLARKIV